MEKYLTYTRYVELGGLLPEAPFNILELTSRKQLDYCTHNRLMSGIPEDIREDIELIMMTLIDDNDKYSTSNGKSSETIDGYSINYGTQEDHEEKMKVKINTLLSGLKKNGVPLTYAGGVNDNKRIYYPIS